MADKKISALTASATPLAGTEVLPIVQSGSTVKVAVSDLTAGRSFNALGMTLTSTDASATAAPLLDLYRDSASPAASDTLGEIEFNGEDSAGNKQTYGVIHGSILSPTSTAEQGQIHFETATAGALTEKMIIGTTNLVINEPGGIFNVRIEGDTDANLFYTDATNSRVGVGTISPAEKLDVVGKIKLSDNLVISTTAKGITTGSAIPLGFGVNNTVSAITIDTLSNLGVGTTTPVDFSIYGYGPTVEARGGRGGSFVTSSSDAAVRGVLAVDSSAAVFYMKTVTNNALAFGVNDVEYWRVNTSGNLVPSVAAKGIDFSANTSAPGMTSELLNWYEEGVFTPNQGGGLVVVGAFSSSGRYVRYGNMITVQVFLEGATSIAWASGAAVLFTNLPFTAKTGFECTGVGHSSNYTTSFSVLTAGTNTVFSVEAQGAVANVSITLTYFV